MIKHPESVKHTATSSVKLINEFVDAGIAGIDASIKNKIGRGGTSNLNFKIPRILHLFAWQGTLQMSLEVSTFSGFRRIVH